MDNNYPKSPLYKVAIARKINAIVSLLCTLLILVHGAYDAIWMYMRGKLPALPKPFAWILLVLVALHAILSIVTAILGSKGKKDNNEKVYKKENIKTILQRILGVLMILFLVFHILGMKNHLATKILHAILHPIFFGAVFTHTAISTSKAFITLGIGSTKFIKIIDIVMYVLCALIFVAALIGMYTIMFGRWQG